MNQPEIKTSYKGIQNSNRCKLKYFQIILLTFKSKSVFKIIQISLIMSSTLNRDVIQIIFEYINEYEQARQAILDEIKEIHHRAVFQEITQMNRTENCGCEGEKEIIWYLQGYHDMIVNCCPTCGHIIARDDCGPYCHRESWGHCKDCGAKQF